MTASKFRKRLAATLHRLLVAHRPNVYATDAYATPRGWRRLAAPKAAPDVPDAQDAQDASGGTITAASGQPGQPDPRRGLGEFLNVPWSNKTS